MQSEINIGMIGHVDHGKTSLTAALSGVWTDRHSEEIKRGITIRLGYADTELRKCPKCEPPVCYTTKKRCPVCKSKTEFLRKVSFVDSPGHETLMATMLSGAAIMDGAVLVIAANEKCPQPQTKEHFMALNLVGVDKIVVVQNKIDLVTRERAVENYREIREFIKKYYKKDVPIIPMSAQHSANIDALIEAIEENIPTPKRDLSEKPLMYIARSFDINKPGTQIEKLCGGVIGGSIKRGTFKVGDEIEIRPGVIEKGRYHILTSEIVSLRVGFEEVESATPGGLVAMGTKLDPSITKADGISGSVVGLVGELPPVWESLSLEINLLEKAIGTKEEVKVEPIKRREMLMLNVATMSTVGIVREISKDGAEIDLRIPVCAEENQRVAICRRIGARWRLVGYGVIR